MRGEAILSWEVGRNRWWSDCSPSFPSIGGRPMAFTSLQGGTVGRPYRMGCWNVWSARGDGDAKRSEMMPVYAIRALRR